MAAQQPSTVHTQTSSFIFSFCSQFQVFKEEETRGDESIIKYVKGQVDWTRCDAKKYER